MKCFTCINFEKAKAKGKIKTSKACDDCWQPDWSKLSPELKQFYTLLSKLTPASLSIFKEYWIDDFVYSINDKHLCGDCSYIKGCKLKPKKADTPESKDCSKWNLNVEKIADFKVQKELKAIFALDIDSREFPYITFFTKQIDLVNKNKPLKIFIGDKFEYNILNKKLKLEVQHLTPENVVASSKDGTRLSLLYSTLRDSFQK